MTPKAIQDDRVNLQVSEEDLLKAKDSAESLRVAINYMSQPKLLAGIYPEKNANWLVSKADEIASFISQLHPGSPILTEHHNPTLPPCMDFLISSGIEKVIQSTIQEMQAFEGLEAPLVQHVLRGQKFAYWLNTLFTFTKNIVKQNPQFLDDFERNIRKHILVCIIKETQKLVDHNLRQQFGL